MTSGPEQANTVVRRSSTAAWADRILRRQSVPTAAAALLVVSCMTTPLAARVDPRLPVVVLLLCVALAAARRGEDVLRAALAEHQHDLDHDRLTGVLGRSAMVLAAARRTVEDGEASMVFVDIDGFHYLNDRLGHIVGDSILIAVAQRLGRLDPAPAVTGRVGSDQFALLIDTPGGRRDAARTVAALVRAFQRPIVVGSSDLHVSVGVGVVPVEAGVSSGTLMRRGLIAIADAKSRGRGQVSWFRDGMDPDACLRASLVKDLAGAAERRELHVVYQPLCDLRTGRTIGAEALLRWQHPVHGNVPPDQFIPLAEASGMITDIGRWVTIQAVTAALAVRESTGRVDFSISVNVSPMQLRNPMFVEDIAVVLASSGLPAEQLSLEITEGVHLEVDHQIQRTLEDLRELGVRIGLDDFGTGYASFGYLHRLPLSFVKLDASFTRLVDSRDPVGMSMLSFLGALPYPVVAEGIEHLSSCEPLLQGGCTYGQGWAFGRPMPEHALQEHLELEDRRHADLSSAPLIQGQ